MEDMNISRTRRKRCSFKGKFCLLEHKGEKRIFDFANNATLFVISKSRYLQQLGFETVTFYVRLRILWN